MDEIRYTITKLKQSEAEQIASFGCDTDNPWTDISQGSEARYYLLHEQYYKASYFAIYEGNKLIGYFSVNDRIRKDYGALQLYILKTYRDRDTQIRILETICEKTKELFPECHYLNGIAWSDHPEAQEIYEDCGFEKQAPIKSSGHDMASYEQEGFSMDESLVEEKTMCIYMKDLRKSL